MIVVAFYLRTDTAAAAAAAAAAAVLDRLSRLHVVAGLCLGLTEDDAGVGRWCCCPVFLRLCNIYGLLLDAGDVQNGFR